MDDRECSNIYAIPANYTDSGKIVGGMLEPRNAVEALILVVLLGYPELMYVLPDDNPAYCSHYYCSASASDDRTEVYVVPKKDFAQWLSNEKSIPDKGVELYESTDFRV